VYNAANQPVLEWTASQEACGVFSKRSIARDRNGDREGFRKQDCCFPPPAEEGAAQRRLLWVELLHSRALQVLHNPAMLERLSIGGRGYTRRPMAKKRAAWFLEIQWILLPCIRLHFLEEYEANLRNCGRMPNRKVRPPEESSSRGTGFASGVFFAARAGTHTVRYHNRDTRAVPRLRTRKMASSTVSLCGQTERCADRQEISDLLLQTMTPMGSMWL